MKKLWVAVWLVASTGMAGEMVTVPDDFGLLEVPDGSQVEIKKEIVLRAQTTRETVVLATQKDLSSSRVLKCELLYQPNSQRRVIPVGTRLETTGTSVSPIAQEAPAVACFKAYKYPEAPSQDHFVALKSASGNFIGTLYCRDQQVWTAPGDIACDYSSTVAVGDLKGSLQFWGDKDALSGTIGLN